MDDLLGKEPVEAHILARAVIALQTRVATLEQQDRELVGRVDVLEGNPDSTRGEDKILSKMRQRLDLLEARTDS